MLLTGDARGDPIPGGLPPVAAAPDSGTDKSRRKGDIHDQAMAELIADWLLDGALSANLTVVTDDVFTTG